MIESCPKKRMLLGITFLGVLTILVLIVESHWTEHTNPSRKRVFIVEQNSTCFEKEHFEIIKECEPCTEFEIASKSIGVCIHTHYKEVLRCASGETVTRSCDKTAFIDERTFWRFEGCMFLASVVATFCALSRKRVLNRRTMQRVQRQLANSV
ncbi:PREDICTED: protein JTB [Nicrophorus vespilloides]|uniref:Protein JTB n=1 Tax=Nicrophorus vespilloides TaxID=110193 RepID=A0ABM1MG48_NICVS|nr:PREDICTED: protein JTB [Nicrophorus vespilloides]